MSVSGRGRGDLGQFPSTYIKATTLKVGPGWMCGTSDVHSCLRVPEARPRDYPFSDRVLDTRGTSGWGVGQTQHLLSSRAPRPASKTELGQM